MFGIDLSSAPTAYEDLSKEILLISNEIQYAILMPG